MRNGLPLWRSLLAALSFLGVDYVLVSSLHVGYGTRALGGLLVALVFTLSGGPVWELGWGRVRLSLHSLARVLLVLVPLCLLLLVATLVAIRSRDEVYVHRPLYFSSPEEMWDWLLLAVLAAPLVEEFIYRGLLQPCLRSLWGPRWAIFASGIVFWIYHWVAYGGITPINQLFAGWLFAYLFERTRSLLAPTLLHALGNLALGGIDLLVLTRPGMVAWLLGN